MWTIYPSNFILAKVIIEKGKGLILNELNNNHAQKVYNFINIIKNKTLSYIEFSFLWNCYLNITKYYVNLFAFI